MRDIIRRLAFKVRDHKRGAGLQQAIAPALLQVPVIQTGQEDLVCRVRDNAVCFVLAFGDECELAVNNAWVVNGKCIDGNYNLEYQVVALLSEIKVIPTGVLSIVSTLPPPSYIRRRLTSWGRPSTIHESAMLALSERAATLSAS